MKGIAKPLWEVSQRLGMPPVLGLCLSELFLLLLSVSEYFIYQNKYDF